MSAAGKKGGEKREIWEVKGCGVRRENERKKSGLAENKEGGGGGGRGAGGSVKQSEMEPRDFDCVTLVRPPLTVIDGGRHIPDEHL